METTTAYKVRIRKGDTVKVIAGKEKGKSGKVLEVNREALKVFVEKVNLVKRHLRPSQKQRQGGIVEKEGPLHLSNVMLVCPHCAKPSRLGVRVLPDGQRLRLCRKCGEVVDKG
jgi:large subunit ribosomal protein L24